MHIYAVTYWTAGDNGGVSAAFTDQAQAQQHFAACVRDTAHPDASHDEIEALVQEAITAGFHAYGGDGSGDSPWYAMETVEVQ